MSQKMKLEWIEGVHYYINPQGYVVLTEAYHLQRGQCCGNGCLHCPYDFAEVPEARRRQLLAARLASQTGNNKSGDAEHLKE